MGYPGNSGNVWGSQTNMILHGVARKYDYIWDIQDNMITYGAARKNYYMGHSQTNEFMYEESRKILLYMGEVRQI